MTKKYNYFWIIFSGFLFIILKWNVILWCFKREWRLRLQFMGSKVKYLIITGASQVLLVSISL